MNENLKRFPMVPLATLPTPVQPLHAVGKRLNHPDLFVKCDDISGPVYGGNKIRKLEFLLGEALDQGCKSVITYGATGSNHALANAICCQKLGLKAISILAPQSTSAHVRKNILMHYQAGAEMILCPHYMEFPEVTDQAVERCRVTDGAAPYIIPAGGTSPTGALGFVNAALEMAEQIKPDVIYIPMGTGGTHAGLLVGLKLAGLNTRVEAIRVTHPRFRTEIHIRQLCREIFEKLELPMQVEDEDIIIRDDFFGEDYGIPTPEGEAAVELFAAQENIQLENTYTGKTVAALLHDLESGRLDGQTVLYWNTLNSRDFSDEIADVDFHALPPEFYAYFS
jgi:1-aminocyclopropane-1-carboxylate deaminase/D-cysteine desulfhydrase-like pyridoxal-dependent ACC family enzyme